MRHIILILGSVLVYVMPAMAQNYWQQHVDYKMQVDLNVETNLIEGAQQLTYTNNSPDTLYKVFYHLYFNAFQPGSMMDVRSRNIPDPDRRVDDRILGLTADEQGYQKINQLMQDGNPVTHSMEGTVLTVALHTPIAPGKSTVLEMDFTAQIPQQIRRSGRDNKEGIEYTVTQWYPKLAEYDQDGWHANEYVGREFYGVWGNFDVKITMDSNYVIAGTGVVQNPNEVGHGYGETMADNARLTWHFKAENVHDFGWAADPDYVHDIIKVDDSLQLHFFYQADTLTEQWREVEPEVVKIFKTVNKNFGRYPYSDFSVIQGGDGGMEYPMCTMVLGNGSKNGKIGLITHESLHNWYYGVLGSNEYLYPWMDEGMTTYAEEFALSALFERDEKDFLSHEYARYQSLLELNIEEPLATPGDLFDYNYSYSVSSYSKGAITQNMLRYIVGDSVFYSAILRYFDTWKFKHPRPSDLLRIMELESGLELDWFFEHWLYTMHHIDYAVNVVENNEKATIEISNVGNLPMPIEVEITLKNGEKSAYYIPLRQMRGAKNTNAKTLKSWAWVDPIYTFEVGFSLKDIERVEVDPRHIMADVQLANNQYPQVTEKEAPKEKKRKRNKKKRNKK